MVKYWHRPTTISTPLEAYLLEVIDTLSVSNKAFKEDNEKLFREVIKAYKENSTSKDTTALELKVKQLEKKNKKLRHSITKAHTKYIKPNQNKYFLKFIVNNPLNIEIRYDRNFKYTPEDVLDATDYLIKLNRQSRWMRTL